MGPEDRPGAQPAHTELTPGSQGAWAAGCATGVPAVVTETVLGGAASLEGASRPPLLCEAWNVPECCWTHVRPLQRLQLRRPRCSAPGDKSLLVETDTPQGSRAPWHHQSLDRNGGTFSETLASDTQQASVPPTGRGVWLRRGGGPTVSLRTLCLAALQVMWCRLCQKEPGEQTNAGANAGATGL